MQLPLTAHSHFRQSMRLQARESLSQIKCNALIQSVLSFFLCRKAQVLDHVLDQEADPDLKTDRVPGLALIHDHAASALNLDHTPDPDLTLHDATDHIQNHAPSHPGTRGPDPSPVQNHDLDQDPRTSPSLDHVLVQHLDHHEMRKLGLLSTEQMRIRIIIQQMVTMSSELEKATGFLYL